MSTSWALLTSRFGVERGNHRGQCACPVRRSVFATAPDNWVGTLHARDLPPSVVGPPCDAGRRVGRRRGSATPLRLGCAAATLEESRRCALSVVPAVSLCVGKQATGCCLHAA